MEVRFEATASGAIADGDMLNLNADGTVEAIGESQVSFASGNAEVVNHEMEDAGGVCWIQGTNKFIVVYNDPTNNFYNTAVVGTVSGTTITYGTPFVYYSSNGDRFLNP